MKLLALAGCADAPFSDEDDRPLWDALARRGIEPKRVAWDDASFDWATADAVFLRSTWDYHRRRDEFLRWAERVDSVTRLWNPLPVIRWNSHKGYLRDLEARGVRTTPTAWLARGERADLGAILRDRGWSEAVVKPTVSGGAWRTMRVGPSNLAEGQAHLDALVAEREVMVQRYLDAVEGYGERSLVFLDGALSHAIRKRPPWSEPGPEGTRVEIAADEAAFAGAAIAAVPGKPALLYARVDTIRDGGEIRLMELELVEPTLFFVSHPPAADRLADAIAKRLGAAAP